MSEYVVLRHVRHRADGPTVDDNRVWRTDCGQQFVPAAESTRDTRFHEPAYSRCDGCYRPPS